MLEYGDKVEYVRTGYIGEIVGFMRGQDTYLVKFEANKDKEMWLPGRSLTLKEKHDD